MVNGTAFGDHSATAITLTNLFRGWPEDRIAAAFTEPIEPNQDVCRRLWRLSLADVPADRAVRRLLGKRQEILGAAAAGMPSGLGGDPGAVEPRTTLHGLASAWADLLPMWPPGEFWEWVDRFRPQAVYSMLGSIRLMGVVLRVAKHCGVVAVPHFMDDWPTTHYRGSRTAIPRAVLLHRIRAVVKRAPLGMSIGSAMSEDYERRFGVRFETFMNCVQVPDERPADERRAPGQPVKFVYVGGLHLDRWSSLLEVGKALSELRAGGLDVELVIHAPFADRTAFCEAFSAVPTIRLGESLAQDQVAPAMRASDVLVHVESFARAVRGYTRLSLSTKVPQYMASGRPILAYGPKEVASCRYIEQSGCGVVVGEENPFRLLEAVRSLVSNPQVRTHLGRRAWQVANEQHSAPSVRERFRATLAWAAESSGAAANAKRSSFFRTWTD